MGNTCSVEDRAAGCSDEQGLALPSARTALGERRGSSTASRPPRSGLSLAPNPEVPYWRGPSAAVGFLSERQCPAGAEHRSRPRRAVQTPPRRHRAVRRVDGRSCARLDRRLRAVLVVVGITAVLLLAAPIWGRSTPARASGPEAVVVEPGDTLAGIVARAVPPSRRGEVDAQLRRELGSDTVVPGERLVVP